MDLNAVLLATHDYQYSEDEEVHFVQTVWNQPHPGHSQPGQSPRAAELTYYFQWLKDYLYMANVNPHDNPFLETYGHLFAVLNLIKALDMSKISRSDLLERVKDRIEDEENIELLQRMNGVPPHNRDAELQNAIEMAIRIWLPLSLGQGGLGLPTLDGGTRIEAGGQPLEWQADESFKSIILKTFYPSPETFDFFQTRAFPFRGYMEDAPNIRRRRENIIQRNRPSEATNDMLETIFESFRSDDENALLKYTVRRNNSPVSRDLEFETLFNLRDIVRLTGFKIQWTRNLADHLCVKPFTNQNLDVFVNIYHDTGFLLQLRTGDRLGDRSKDLVDETLKTLALLIPPYDDVCQEWFERQLGATNIDNGIHPAAGHQLEGPLWPGEVVPRRLSASRKVDDYVFWGPRLLALQQHFNEPKSVTLKSWFLDRRDTKEWWSFIVSLTAFVVALIALLLTIGILAAGIYTAVITKPPAPDDMSSSASYAAITSAAPNASMVGPLVVCCNPGMTSDTNPFQTPTTFGPAFTPSSASLVTVTASVTATISETILVTSTFTTSVRT